MKIKTTILFILLASFTIYAGKTTKIVILHTNDTHSQIEPTESKDEGGYARRLGVIDSIRAAEPNVLLLDAGDFFQGSPYFNFFNGRVEIEGMNRMGYDAVTLGNHEFDNGIDTLANVLQLAKFPIVNANYDVSKTPLKPFIKPYIILHKGGLKIGIFGLGVQPKGLVFQKNYESLIFIDPIKTAIEISDFLRITEKCDVVICLSHLGADVVDANAATDYDVAKSTRNVDVIIGGHSHQILLNKTENNAAGKPVIIAQMGKSGLNVGKIDLTFEKKKEKK